MQNNIFKNFIKYVSLNVLGMIGLSCYILVDTFFISKALGSLGIAALNFSISIYSLIHGAGLMIGIGGATRYSILKSQKEGKKADEVFSICLKLGLIIGLIFAIIGIFGARSLALILGADASTFSLTKTYLKTILCFAPFFIVNNIMLAFIRNDNNPNLSMIAMMLGSFSNIILDYVFMFPLGMGMFGAAFATCLAPIISMGVLSIHFIKKRNDFRYTKSKMVLSSMCDVLSLGLSSFISEVSSSIVLITFNLAILGLKGNLGVASYGIVANIALVGIAVFTGIAQGIQPIVSKEYGLKNHKAIGKVLKFALITSLTVATTIYLSTFFNSDSIIAVFNSEQNPEIAQISKTGLRIYFIGFFFAGINLIMAMYLSAVEQAKHAFFISIARGCIIIVPLVLLLSKLWQMTGVWMSFVLTESIVTFVSVFIFCKRKRVKINE